MQTVFHLSSEEPADRRHAMENVSNFLDDGSVSPSADDAAVVANGSGIRLFVSATSEHPSWSSDSANAASRYSRVATPSRVSARPTRISWRASNV